METSLGLSEAISFVNEVHSRFSSEHAVFKSFLHVVDLYRKGLIDMNACRLQVSALFEYHPDLRDGFLVFTSDVVDGEKKKKSLGSVVERLEKLGLKGAYDKGRLLFKKIAGVLGLSAFMKFLSHCRNYGAGEIQRSDLSLLASGLLGDSFPVLLNDFYDFLDCCENAGGGSFGGALGGKSSDTKKRKRSPSGEEKESSDQPDLSKKRKRSPSGDEKEFSDQPDLSMCRRLTPSYRLLPSKGQSPNPEDDHLLNDFLVCVNLNYSTSTGRVKGEEERLRDDYEDKRYEMDMLLASMASAKEAAELLLKKIEDNPDNSIRIGEYLQAKNLRSIGMLYGDHEIEVVDCLHDNPRDVLPVIIPRMQQKLEQIKEWAKSFSFKNYCEKIAEA